MKRLSHFFISLSLTVILFPIFNYNALCTPLKNIFEQWIYKVDSQNVDFNPGEYSLKLISKDSICYIYIIDKDNIQRFSKRFDSTDLDNASLFTTGTLLDGDRIIIFVKGEFYINPLKQ